jgi:hypothetical protein
MRTRCRLLTTSRGLGFIPSIGRFFLQYIVSEMFISLFISDFFDAEDSCQVVFHIPSFMYIIFAMFPSSGQTILYNPSQPHHP